MPDEKCLEKLYPKSYYAYAPPSRDFFPHGLKHRGVWLTLHHLKHSRGYDHLPVNPSRALALLGHLIQRKPQHFSAPTFREGGVLLDYGSGSGTTVAFMEHIGWRAEGIELNGDAARAGVEAGLRIHHGSIDVLEQRKNHYDCIMSSHCVEHVPEMKRLFKAFWGALKPGGTLVVDIPNADAVGFDRFREFCFYLTMPVHVHLYTPASILHLAQEVGFTNGSTATYSLLKQQGRSLNLMHQAAAGTAQEPQFGPQSPWQTLLGRLRALPTYVSSRIQDRGDCLVLKCVKPMEADSGKEC